MLARNFSNKQESDGRNISIIVEFELLTASSGISKLPKPRTVEELESATNDDTLADSADLGSIGQSAFAQAFQHWGMCSWIHKPR